eukprot:12405878-Karenia_brevis.AAC.1
MGLEDWATTIRRRQWKWTEKLANDLADHWAGTIFKWEPTTTQKFGTRGRPQGRPKKHWHEDVQNFLQIHGYNDFLETAKNKQLWKDLESDYVKHYSL